MIRFGDDLLESAAEVVFGREAQLVAQGGDVADPVALLEDVILVGVERGGSAGHAPDRLGDGADHARQPERDAGVEDVPTVEQLLDEAGELVVGVDVAVGHEVAAAHGLGALEGQPDDARQVFGIDEREALGRAADLEVEARADALDLHPIVAVAGAVDARGPEDGVGDRRLLADALLGGQFAAAVDRFGPRLIVGRDGSEGAFVAAAEGAEAAHQYKAIGARGLAAGVEGSQKSAGVFGVDLEEVGRADGLRHARVVDHAVPPPMLGRMFAHLGGERLGVGITEVDQVNAVFGQPAEGAALSHARPDLISALQRLPDKVSADESAGSSDQNLFHARKGRMAAAFSEAGTQANESRGHVN